MSTIGLNEEVNKKYIQNQEVADRFGADLRKHPFRGCEQWML